MTSKHAPTQGTCLCGTVRYEVDGPFKMMVHCHCSMCRKHHGGRSQRSSAAPLMGFRWIAGEDNIATYTSSEKGQRSFCRTCGSVTPTLMKEMDIAMLSGWQSRWAIWISVRRATVFVGSKAPWYTITRRLAAA